MTSLAKQLERLVVPHTQALLGSDTRKTSFLFKPVDAAALDRETFFALGINGLEELESIDSGFEEFHRSLFSDASQTFERSVQTKDVNEKLDKTIESFLLKLSPYFLLRPAHKALEWLIHRYHIQFYNIDELMMCVLPYHETKLFVRAVQLINLESHTASKWDWFLPLQKSGVHLSRATLVNHCRTNPAFLAFVCNMVPRFIKAHTSDEDAVNESPLRVVFSFYATTVVGVLEAGPVTKQLVSSLFESIVQGLRSRISDYTSAAYITLAQVVSRSQLKRDLLEPVTNIVCKYMSPAMQREATTCLLLIYQKQDITTLRKKAFKYLSRQVSLPSILYDLSEHYEVNSLVFPLVKRLVPAAFKQAALNVVSSDSSDNDDDNPPLRLMTLLQELLTWLPLENNTAMFIASEVLEQYLTYIFHHNSEDNDSLMQIVKGVIRQLEGRYSDVVNTAVENVLNSCETDEKKAAIMSFLNVSALSERHQLISTNSKSLVLSLNHPQPSVRRSAVQFMMKNKDQLEDRTFLSDSILPRLQDDNVSVVSAVLENCQNLSELVEDQEALEDCLLKLLQRCDGKEKWRDVATSVVTVLCTNSSVSLRVIFSYLPLISGSQSELDISRFILKNSKNPIIKHISGACLRCLPKTAKEDKVAIEDVVSFNLNITEKLAVYLLTSADGQIQHVVEQLCKSKTEIGSRRELILFELLLLTLYHVIEKTRLDKDHVVEMCAVQAQLLRDMQLRNLVSKTHSKIDLSLDDVVSTMITQLQKNKLQIPSMSFLFFIQHLALSTSIPAPLQDVVFWQYSGSDKVVDVWLKMVVTMFGLVVAMAMDLSSGCCQNARKLTGVIIKHLFSDTTQLFKFLSLLWTYHVNDQRSEFNLTPTLQVTALKLGHAALANLNQKEAGRILQTAAPVVVSLLVVCASVHQPVRQAGLECLKQLCTVTQKSAVFAALVQRVVHCEQEVISDSSFVSQLIVSVLGSSSELQSDSGSTSWSPRQQRKSKRRSSAPTMLSSLINVALDDTMPDFVTRAVISLTRDINTVETFAQLLLLMERYSKTLSSQQLTLCEADSLQILLRKFTPEVAGCLDVDSTGLKTLVWAINCNKPLHHDRPAVQDIVIPLITPAFYEGLPSSECQHQLLSCLLDVKVHTEDVDVAAAVKKVIKHLTVDANHVVCELNPVLQMLSPATVRETKRKRVSLHQEESSEFDSAVWRRVVVVLEVMQDKKKLDNADVLVPVCFQVMARVLELDNHVTAEYTKQLLLTTVYNICKRLYADQKDVKISSEQFNMELIVQCVRTSDNPQTHHQALLLLTVAAHICPELLLHNIMSVFTFMGTNILRQDDQYSFHVISQILETVIPALALACEQKASSTADVSSRIDVMTTVLRVFAAALPHIPKHRKVVVFTKLISTVGETEFLWRFLLLVLEHSITADPHEHEAESADRKESSPVTGDTLDFITRLAVSFGPAVQLHAARGAVAYLARLPVVTPTNTVVRARSTPNQLAQLRTEDVEIFSFTFHTAKQMRHFKYAVIHMFVHLFSSPEFIAQVATGDEKRLLKNFQKFLSELLQYIMSTTKMADRNQDNPTSKFWRALLHKTYELLDKVVSLLPDSVFLTAVSGLMHHDLPTVQCKAMELLTNKLQHGKDVGKRTLQDQLLPLVDQLMDVVTAMVRHVKSGDERVKTGTVALYTLNVLCRLLGETNPQLFIKVLGECCRVLSACRTNPSVLACALLCVAEICSSLKIHIIQHLATFMPKIFKIMNKDELIRNDLLQLGAVTAIHRIVESLPHFISPYLLQVTKQVCCNLSPERGIPQKPQVQQRVKAIRHTLATAVPTRVLLPTVISCYEDAAENMQECVPSVLVLLEEHISVMNKEDLGSFYNQLLTFFFTALSFRELHPQADLSLVTSVESAVIETLITMVMKMSEASFRPMLFKIFDWATRQDGTKDRVLVFYQLANRLAGKLKSLFTLFAGHIIKHAAQTLDENNVAKTDTKYFGPGKAARQKSCELVTCIVDCLYKCFLYDSEGFVNKERFDSLMQHLVDQIENTLPQFEARISEHLVPCIARFAVAAQDDSLWRSLSYQILLKTRSAEPKVRLAALDVIDAFNKKLGEDFMSLLPETIPFLAELMEDDNEDVERRCQAVIADMEKTLGEPLQKYF